MKLINLALGLSLFLLFFGCLNPEVVTPPPGVPVSQPPLLPGCKIVTITEPYEETVCYNITYTDEVCERKALEYSVSQISTVDLCTSDGGCVGKDISTCLNICQSAMKRCRMNLTNLDDTSAGVWVVGANFTTGKVGFDKEPTSAYIKAGDTFTFDYSQLYSLGLYGNSMACSLFVVGAPVVDVCHMESRDDTQCDEITRYKTVEREVCE
ncbi:MAG: hypothetical protein ABII71_02975 [Candidatus Micrarchaeota archaeon]